MKHLLPILILTFFMVECKAQVKTHPFYSSNIQHRIDSIIHFRFDKYRTVELGFLVPYNNDAMNKKFTDSICAIVCKKDSIEFYRQIRYKDIYNKQVLIYTPIRSGK